MVKIVSKYKAGFPGEGADLKINRSSPLYACSDIVANCSSATAWTRKARNDRDNLEYDNLDLFNLALAAARDGRYKNSEWCQSKPGGPWAACDAYSLVRIERDHENEKDYRCEYYVKFGISDTGTVLLIVSCHL